MVWFGYPPFMNRDLAEVDYVYMWADGIHLNVRLEEAGACVLVLIGARAEVSRTAKAASAPTSWSSSGTVITDAAPQPALDETTCRPPSSRLR